jgi:hypothetical protein
VAQRRMFNLKIIDSAKFLKMPVSSQLLYFHLCMRADDDGVVEGFNILRMTGLNEDDLKILITKGYVQVLNDDLVSFIIDWREHNLIRADRKIDSIYKDLLLKVIPQIDIIEPRERADSKKKEKGGRPTDNQRTDKGQHRLGKVSIGKDKLVNEKVYIDLRFIDDVIDKVKITQEQYDKLVSKYNKSIVDKQILELDNYIVNGKGNKYKDHYRTLNHWISKKSLEQLNTKGVISKENKPKTKLLGWD